MATKSVRFQLRDVKSDNEILLNKEPGIRNGVLKIGDGVNTWSNLNPINTEIIIVDVADIVDNQRVDYFLELTAKYINKEIDILFEFENIIFTPSAIGNEGWFFCAFTNGFYVYMAVLYEHGQLVVESREGETVPPNGVIARNRYGSKYAHGDSYDFIQDNEILYAKYKKSVTKESIADLSNSDWEINNFNCDAGYGKFKVDTVRDYDMSRYWLYIGYAWDNTTKQYIATPNSVIRTNGEDYNDEPLSLTEILTIQEGDDAQNPLLISWLQQHGDLLGVYEYKPLGQGGGESSVQDVKIDGTSIVQDGVANIPIWTTYGGIMYSHGNGFAIVPANVSEITNRSPARKPVTMEVMDTAVKEAIVNPKAKLNGAWVSTEWTNEEKAKARKTLGISEGLHTYFIQTASVGSLYITTKGKANVSINRPSTDVYNGFYITCDKEIVNMYIVGDGGNYAGYAANALYLSQRWGEPI